MEYIDLHLHSSFSDGTMSPTQLVGEAVLEEIKAIAITDHDTIEGVAEAFEAGRMNGIEVISGVELSAYHAETPMHILGYGFSHDDQSLSEKLQKVQQARNERNLAILKKLNTLGLQVTHDDLAKFSPTGQAGRPHIASLLVEKKIVKTMDEAFAKYLRKDGLAYASRQKLMAEDAISMIRSAGGIAVLAHPLTLDRSMTLLPSILDALIELGLQGVEAYYPIHSVSVRKKLIALSQQKGLFITGGSDYHGTIRNGTRLGGNNKKQQVPYDLLATLKHQLPELRTNS
ncbi:MAG: PHP domain-containing protein [Desulfobulbaceae bacterium]|nr:PHP domain-containing protein [Desulfobulbaceae bacterium]